MGRQSGAAPSGAHAARSRFARGEAEAAGGTACGWISRGGIISSQSVRVALRLGQQQQRSVRLCGIRIGYSTVFAIAFRAELTHSVIALQSRPKRKTPSGPTNSLAKGTAAGLSYPTYPCAPHGKRK